MSKKPIVFKKEGPVYSGWILSESIPLGGECNFMQAVPDAQELERCVRKGFPRVVGAYEVLCENYRREAGLNTYIIAGLREITECENGEIGDLRNKVKTLLKLIEIK